MDFTKFQIPQEWPSDAKDFAREAISEISELKAMLKQTVSDILLLRTSLEKAHAEIRELKAKIGTNSTNSGRPPSKDPPDTPPRDGRPSGRARGAQKGHPGAGRKLFPPDRIDKTRDVFPLVCPNSKTDLTPFELVSVSLKRVHQIDLPTELNLIVTEVRLHTCHCPCGCGKTVSAVMPPDLGNTAVGPKLKAMMALLASRYHMSKRLIQEILIDLFGSDASFSVGCISEAEEEISNALEKPHQEARESLKTAEAIHVDETSWFLNHDICWIWVAVSDAVTVFSIDAHRSRAAFERFVGNFEGFIISDRYSAYSKLSPEERQVCWAHLKRDFKKLVDRKGGAENVGTWALQEIETMFGVWHLYLDGLIDLAKLRNEFVTIRARFGRLLRSGLKTTDPKATKFCDNLLELWPALWNFLQRPDILQPTNNTAEQAIRNPVIGRGLSFGSQSERGLRFVKRMLTAVTTLRKQGRGILDFLENALMSFRNGGIPPSLLQPSSG